MHYSENISPGNCTPALSWSFCYFSLHAKYMIVFEASLFPLRMREVLAQVKETERERKTERERESVCVCVNEIKCEIHVA